jgi:hypothetical protein
VWVRIDSARAVTGRWRAGPGDIGAVGVSEGNVGAALPNWIRGWSAGALQRGELQKGRLAYGPQRPRCTRCVL